MKGLIAGYYLDGPQMGSKITDISAMDTSYLHWLHFDYTQEESIEWLTEKSDLEPHIYEALLNEESRPRATQYNDGMLVCFRGVNLSPNADPEDMVSIRLWIEKNRIISSRQRKLQSIREICEYIAASEEPTSAGDFIVLLTQGLTSKMQDTIEDIEDKLSDLEENINEIELSTLRTKISQTRRQAIALRRYLTPQRDAFTQLQLDKTNLLSESNKHNLKEVLNHLLRYLEDLEMIRERTVILREEVESLISEQLNTRMYLFSVITLIFLPLGFFTGLFGINVGGMPGVENPFAFYILTAALVLFVVLQLLYLRKKKWF